MQQTRRNFFKSAAAAFVGVVAAVYCPTLRPDGFGCMVNSKPMHLRWKNYTATYEPVDKKVLIEKMRVAMGNLRLRPPSGPIRIPGDMLSRPVGGEELC